MENKMAKTKVDALALSVGKAIAARRQDAGLTQEQVAEQLKIGNEAVSRMERGLVMPTVARLLELAACLTAMPRPCWWSPATARRAGAAPGTDAGPPGQCGSGDGAGDGGTTDQPAG
jgi:DNA-binding XRE family transcriptional regulator